MDEFKKSFYSGATIAGALGSGITASLRNTVSLDLQKEGDIGASKQKFYGSLINAGISTTGKLTEYGVYSAYALSEGRTLADAYNDMGGITFNVANLGVIADIIATNTERTNATGQGNTWSKLAENLSGMGILELNIGTEGITASLGTDGFDLFFGVL